MATEPDNAGKGKVPPPRLLVWVRCDQGDVLAYRDFDGTWKNTDGDPLSGIVVVLCGEDPGL